MKKIRHAIVFLLIFIVISAYVMKFATNYLYLFSSKIIPFAGSAVIFSSAVLLWDKVEVFIKKQLILYGDRRKKYKQTLRLIKNMLKREDKEDKEVKGDKENEENQKNNENSGICIINDIEKRKVGLRVVYNSFTLEENILYEEYKDYIKEVEEHFCNASFKDLELLAWDFRYIVCEIERCKHISLQVCEKIIMICEEIVYSSIDIKENIKVEYITCLEKLVKNLQFASPEVHLPTIQGQIEDALIKLGKKRIASNMRNKISQYQIHINEGDRPNSDLEYYAWYSSYMTYKKEDLSCAQLIRYLRTMDFYYSKTSNMILAENSKNVELTKQIKQELRYIIDASQLYEALIYNDESRDACEELSEIFGDTFEILTKLFIKVN